MKFEDRFLSWIAFHGQSILKFTLMAWIMLGWKEELIRGSARGRGDEEVRRKGRTSPCTLFKPSKLVHEMVRNSLFFLLK